MYSELDDELDILDNCSSSSSSPLKESTFSKLAGQAHHFGTAVVGPWEQGKWSLWLLSRSSTLADRRRPDTRQGVFFHCFYGRQVVTKELND